MKDIKPAILLFIIFTIICGGIYPAVVTGIAHAVFPKQAAGSFITDKSGKEIGSTLIGQPFSDPKYFWPRPSAATDFGYNAMASGGSNSGPTNPDYLKTVGDRVKALRDSGVTGTDPGRPGAGLGQRPRPAHHARVGPAAGATCRQGARCI